STINSLTGFFGFQLHIGCSPQLIPPLVPDLFTLGTPPEDICVAEIIEHMLNDICTAGGNLLALKVGMAHQANKHRALDFLPVVGDHVLLNMSHYRHDNAHGHSNQVAK
ncbi:hypothetical protein EDD18DRAFT_1025323, partial [Armillaria luteobubalina]